MRRAFSPAFSWGDSDRTAVIGMEGFFQCINCRSDYETAEMIYECPRCHDLLEIRYDYERMASQVDTRLWRSRPFSVWRYIEQLPISDKAKIVTLGEGGTGLHRSENLADDLKLNKLRIKFEGENPTGSFKDRGMTVSVSKVLETSARVVTCTVNWKYVRVIVRLCRKGRPEMCCSGSRWKDWAGKACASNGPRSNNT